MAQRPKAKPKSKGPKSTSKNQAERFKKAARDLDVDESGKKFERAFETIVKPKPLRSQNPKEIK